MSDIDLNAALEAAARELYAHDRVPDDESWPEWEALVKGSTDQQWWAIGYRDTARRAFAEFAPLIAAQVRAQIAAEIEALRGTDRLVNGRTAISTVVDIIRAAS